MVALLRAGAGAMKHRDFGLGGALGCRPRVGFLFALLLPPAGSEAHSGHAVELEVSPHAPKQHSTPDAQAVADHPPAPGVGRQRLGTRPAPVPKSTGIGLNPPVFASPSTE